MLGIKRFLRDKIDFVEHVNRLEHMSRINNVRKIQEYILRNHKVLTRPNIFFKEAEFETAKIIFNTIKSVLDAHTSYVMGNPVSLSGEQDIIAAYNRVYKNGGYYKTDYEITEDLYKYGNAFEYVYLDGNTIKSKVIANEDSYPIYDDKGSYIYFIEYWRDANKSNLSYGDGNFTVYYPDKVEEYCDRKLINVKSNLTGLPIHYCGLDKSAYTHFGDSLMNDLIIIMDKIEYLISKMDDSITTLSLSPIAVSTGQRIKESIPKDIVGTIINMEEGADFNYKVATLDYNSIKLELDTLLAQFYAVAGIPSVIMGQSNIANVSEVSLKMLFNMTDNKAKKTIHVLKEGMNIRFNYIRKLLALLGKTFPDEMYDTLDINFNVNRPVDTSSLMQELKMQREMGAISKQTVVDISPYTSNVALEIERINKENDNMKEVNLNG